MRFFTDKYFTKSKRVLEHAGLNPVVKYRVFMRTAGIAALEPMRILIEAQLGKKDYNLKTLKNGMAFSMKDTIATLEGRIQDLIDLETSYLQWAATPCEAAIGFNELQEEVPTKTIIDMHARHASGPEEVALISHGAAIGGCKFHSTDVGANALDFLKHLAEFYKEFNGSRAHLYTGEGVGTMPHALIAAFHGNYIEMCRAYLDRFPNEKLVVLIDYNNKEIEDTLSILNEFGTDLGAVRIDTCGENVAQGDDGRLDPRYADQHFLKHQRGVTLKAVEALRKVLDENDGKHVQVVPTSGFDARKTRFFQHHIPDAFQKIGSGSFKSFSAMATSDIMWVDHKKQCKVGREWGYERDTQFDIRLL